MKKFIDLGDIRSSKYYENEENTGWPCLICGKSVESTENKIMQMWPDICNRDPKALKWYKDNYLHMSTDGHLYFADEEVADGEESQGCFAVGCNCMKKYRSMRKMLGI